MALFTQGLRRLNMINGHFPQKGVENEIGLLTKTDINTFVLQNISEKGQRKHPVIDTNISPPAEYRRYHLRE
jgi:hypothetical protein